MLTRAIKPKIGVMAPGKPDREILARFESLLEESGAEIVRAPAPCDSPEGAWRAGVFFKTADVDCLFLFLPEYAPSGMYMQGVLACPAPVVVASAPAEGGSGMCLEARQALRRCLKSAAGILNGNPAYRSEAAEWVRAAAALRAYKGAIFGLLGCAPDDALSQNADPTAFTGAFGVHVRMLETCLLENCVSRTDQAQTYSARLAAGLALLADENHLSGLACGSRDTRYRNTDISAACASLTCRGFAAIDQGDMGACVAVYTLISAFGSGIPVRLDRMDYARGIICPILPTSCGDILPGGNATLLCLSLNEENRFSFVTAESEIVEGAVCIAAGSNFPDDWAEAGGGMRCAVTSGCRSSALLTLVRLLGIECRRVIP